MYANHYEHTPTNMNPGLAAAGFHEKQIEIGGVHINYVVGPDHGPALVLVPAQMGTWESYGKVLEPLSRRFQVYALDVRGHGKSSWTPGDYSWASIGRDMEGFLRQAVQRPAIVAGNSSGGLIALWCAANLPEAISGLVLEDAPVFSAEMPRFRDRDKFVYNGLEHAVKALGDLEHRDLADYLRGQVLPVSEARSKRVPDWVVEFLSKRIQAAQAARPDQPVELMDWYWPQTLKLLVKSLSMFDPDFARAFVDGRFYAGLDHAEALRRVRCPVLVLHANWRRYEQHGLVGAMDADDAARIRELVPEAQYQRIAANHVVHAFRPAAYVEAVSRFAAGIARPRS